MNRWTRLNLLLGICAAILLAVDRWPQQAQDYQRLTTLDPEQIDSIRIERGARLEIVLERQGGVWLLQHPEAAPANPGRVAALLAVAVAPVQQRFAAAGLAEFGLDHPPATLYLDGTRLAFGARDPAQRSRYVLVDGAVSVIDDLYFNLLGLPARHYRQD